MVELTEEKTQAFIYAVKNDYWYQMYIDGLPIWGKVGEKDPNDKKQHYIYTHKKFEIGYNGNRIVDITLSTQGKELLTPGAKIKFSYEVRFAPSTVKFEDRFDKYLDPVFFQHRVCSISTDSPNKIIKILIVDPLVQHFQQLHDGHLFGRPGLDDFIAHTKKRLRSL